LKNIDIDLKIEVESLLGKLGMDYTYDSEIGGWLFREKNSIIFMSVSSITDIKVLSFFVKLGKLQDTCTKDDLYFLLNQNMNLAFSSFAISKGNLYMKYVTQIRELDSEEFLIALKVVNFSIEKCINLIKNLVKPLD